MEVLRSPTNEAGANFQLSGEQPDDDMGPHEQLINVKFYLYGENKALRQRMFPKAE